MRPPLTNSHQAWQGRLSAGLSFTVVLLSAIVLYGWVHADPALQRLGLNGGSVNSNSALGFLVFGISILGYEWGRRELSLLAIIPAVLGAARLLHPLIGANLGLEYVLGRDERQLASIAMHPAPAICFLLAGATIPWLARPRANAMRTVGLAFAGSIICSVGFSTLLGYWLSLPAVYHWGSPQDLAAGNAVLLLLFGNALFLVAWREQQADEPGAPGWLPMPAIVASTTLTAILWLGLREAESLRLAAATQASLRDFATGVGRELERDLDATQGFADRLGQDGVVSEAEWRESAKNLRNALAASPTFTNINQQLVTIWSEPASQMGELNGVDHGANPIRKNALRLARDRGRAQISETIKQGVDGPGFALYAPIRQGAQTVGYIGADFSYRHFFGTITRAFKLNRSFRANIWIGPDLVYISSATLRVNSNQSSEESFEIGERNIRVQITPSIETLRKNRRYLPELALAAGCGITLLLGLSIHLARTARRSLRTAEISNLKLVLENEERRRIEQRLKVSDERLRLALDSTQIGIFEWNVATDTLYYSPGIGVLLGYQPDALPSTLASWTDLIHPEDVAGYRAAVDQQVKGALSFIDPEYRIRTSTGQWRWLYARSKTVAQKKGGGAEQVIGTLQDISARKRAEEALRVSQATTRKLSLVASKTDNLVIIASPEGTVEWVNESFERVMEYPLGEVAGRNPVDFMIGPDTDRRTVQRIQSAMRKGVGISTDVVNYSRSGRKYHLQLEIQPVRSEAGVLENFIAIQADISARVETEKNLRRAKTEADDASRAKSEFLASMSHEIRTPMNGVIGMTSLLMDTPLNSEQRDYVVTIRNSGDALLTIINDILDFSKIESGKLELEHLPFELAVCIEDSLDLFSVQAAGKKLELVYDISEGVPTWVQGDMTRLRQILVNLVNNAVKFTPAGSIAVKVRCIDASTTEQNPTEKVTLEFSVFDTGIGIPPDRLHRLFRPFSQVDSSTTRKYGGTGLGLAICQRLCTLMGGKIGVSSIEGTGSTFSFSLQLEPVLTPPGWGLPELPLRLNYGEILVVDDHPVTQSRLQTFFQLWGARSIAAPSAKQALARLELEPRPVAIIIDCAAELDPDSVELCERIRQSDIPAVLLISPGESAERLSVFAGRRGVTTATKPLRTHALIRAIQNLFDAPPDSLPPFVVPADAHPLAADIPLDILLVEDNAVNQKVALRFLDRLGYRADAVANGIEALDTLGNRVYHLILMDLQMPEMDGFETARQIRSRLAPEKQPKIVALTANALHGDRDECLAAGMDDYISKPVKLLDIAQVIRRQFSRSSRPPMGQLKNNGTRPPV